MWRTNARSPNLGVYKPAICSWYSLAIMKKHLFVAALAIAAPISAQRTVTEITKPTTIEDDSKANSDKVPEVYAISGQLQRVVVLRFKYQADLLAGIEKMVKEQNIK